MIKEADVEHISAGREVKESRKNEARYLERARESCAGSDDLSRHAQKKNFPCSRNYANDCNYNELIVCVSQDFGSVIVHLCLKRTQLVSLVEGRCKPAVHLSEPLLKFSTHQCANERVPV